MERQIVLFEQSIVIWEGDPSDRLLFLLWKLELKRLNTKPKQTASNDNTPFEESKDIAGPSHVLSPIVEGNEDTAIAGQSNIPSPFKKYIFCLHVGKKKPQKKKLKERKTRYSVWGTWLIVFPKETGQEE